jgi:hypothetical protein
MKSLHFPPLSMSLSKTNYNCTSLGRYTLLQRNKHFMWHTLKGRLCQETGHTRHSHLGDRLNSIHVHVYQNTFNMVKFKYFNLLVFVWLKSCQAHIKSWDHNLDHLGDASDHRGYCLAEENPSEDVENCVLPKDLQRLVPER